MNFADYDILIACECSGHVRDAFIEQGLRAISCDLKPNAGPHYQGDVREIIQLPWPAMIAHPVCRYMANSGVRWLHERPERWKLLEQGCEFFNLFDKAEHIPFRCVENPIIHRYAKALIGRGADQYIQPHWFGSPYQKATGLWLHGLPPLVRKYTLDHYSERGIEIEQAVWRMPPSESREEKRSETYPLVAMAMAKQWAPWLQLSRNRQSSPLLDELCDENDCQGGTGIERTTEPVYCA